MHREQSFSPIEQHLGYSRRQFLGGALAATASGALLGDLPTLAAEQPAPNVEPASPKRKIKLGLIGCGNRGGWIAPFFRQHGGYEMHAVADYFQELADNCGDAVGVDKRRRFSGLSGYKKVIESGVEAIALETPPAFFPEQAAAAVEAGLHVYLAKPVAVDVPGCLRIEAAGKRATQKQRVFLVDYQLPTDPGNIEVARRILAEERGKLAAVETIGQTGGHIDPPRKATIEDLLPNRWANYLALGGGWIVSFDIHAIDAAMWVIGKRPVAAMGGSRICRSNPHGTAPMRLRSCSSMPTAWSTTIGGRPCRTPPRVRRIAKSTARRQMPVSAMAGHRRRFIAGIRRRSTPR